MATDYGNVFQDRYMKALSAFTDAASQGRDPREVLTEMQSGAATAGRAVDPTYGQATGRKNLPTGSITDVTKHYGTRREDFPPTDLQSSAATEMEFKQYQKDLIDRGPDFGADLKRLAIELGMVDESEADMLTLEELQALSHRLAPTTRPIGSGSTSDMEFKAYMQDALDAAGGGINALGSTPEHLLFNLGRKLQGGP
tara:strand:- start:3335 stop:3928 length:594 start_codon:yes stop_codon:yes gene_type:complete